MAEPRTVRTKASVAKFLASVEDPRQRADARQVAALMREVTGAKAEMWGPSIVGFGTQLLRYADGRELPWPQVAFSPRKGTLVLYLEASFPRRAELLRRLGRHTTGKACLYIKRLDDVDPGVLRELVERSVAHHGSRAVTAGREGRA